MRGFVLAVLFGFAIDANAQIAANRAGETGQEAAVRKALSTFYEGWNAHDPDLMDSVFADDVDHINVFGNGTKARQTFEETSR